MTGMQGCTIYYKESVKSLPWLSFFISIFVNLIFPCSSHVLISLYLCTCISRDIKPENILLHKQCTVVKIADFGLAKRIVDPSGQFHKGCGTPEYAAPELLYGRPYGM
jgi:serine/threonine protein kinase